MKVAITGASGYVGTCITNCFRAHGHEVLALSRRPCTAPWTSYALGDDPLLLPWDDVDVLVHAAYDFTPRTWREIVDRNVTPSVELLRAAKNAKVGRLIYISSMSSFEGCRSNYGKAKMMIEKQALQMGAAVVRPGLVWGETSGGVMGALEKLVVKFPVVPFLTGGAHPRQFLIHEADLSQAIVAIAESLPSGVGDLHSVTQPNPVALLEILRSIAKRSHRFRIYLPVPWQLVMVGLKLAEVLGIRFMFRSDSLVGLIHGNPRPTISIPPIGIHYRAFV